MKNEILVVELHDKRAEIDAVLKSMKTIVQSDEVGRAYLSTRRAFAWMGKALQALNTPNPYPKSTDPKSKVIEERADQSQGKIDFLSSTPLEAVKELRSILDEKIEWIQSISETSAGKTDTLKLALKEIYVSLCDAKMDLGWELNRVFNMSKKDVKAFSDMTIEEISKNKTYTKWLA